MINHKDKIINTYQQTKEHYSKINLNELRTRVLTRMSQGNFKMSCQETNASAVFPLLFFFFFGLFEGRCREPFENTQYFFFFTILNIQMCGVCV